MLQSFTRNYEDNSTSAGFQFTFYCDICNDGFKSSFIESETYKRGKGLRGLSQGIGVLGSLVGGRVGNIGYSMERGGNILSERFEGESPEWHKEHQNAFAMAQNEAKRFFHRCHGCHLYVCDACFNENEGLCTDCAPRQEIYVAKARAEAMRRTSMRPEWRLRFGRARLKARSLSALFAESQPVRANSATTAGPPWR